MSYSGYVEDAVTDKQFNETYKMIYEDAIKGMVPGVEKCTIILGGQPGAGKSHFYQMREDLLNYIAINGDEYRKFHPNYDSIIRTDPEHYAERTQSFCNKVVESMISDLGEVGYNLIIEGTLRNPDIPIGTCEFLNGKGYHPDLIVVVYDAEKAWKETLTRAVLMKEHGIAPRLVPIDIYNNTVNQLPHSLDKIEKRGCFASITIINRDGEPLYKQGHAGRASDVLLRELNLENWNAKLSTFEKEFMEEKIHILQSSLQQMKAVDNVFERK